MSFLTDDYEAIRLRMVQFCETGSLETPNHGRGKRGLRRNCKYASSGDEEEPKELLVVTQEKVFLNFLLPFHVFSIFPVMLYFKLTHTEQKEGGGGVN